MLELARPRRQSKKERLAEAPLDFTALPEKLAVLAEYMPAALSDDEVNAEVAAAVASTGAAGPQDMGRVMAVLKPKLAGRADMTKVSGLVKSALAKG